MKSVDADADRLEGDDYRLFVLKAAAADTVVAGMDFRTNVEPDDPEVMLLLLVYAPARNISG